MLGSSNSPPLLFRSFARSHADLFLLRSFLFAAAKGLLEETLSCDIVNEGSALEASCLGRGRGTWTKSAQRTSTLKEHPLSFSLPLPSYHLYPSYRTHTYTFSRSLSSFITYLFIISTHPSIRSFRSSLSFPSRYPLSFTFSSAAYLSIPLLYHHTPTCLFSPFIIYRTHTDTPPFFSRFDPRFFVSLSFSSS